MDGGASSDVVRDAGIDVGCAAERPDICVLARLRGKVLTFYRFDHAKGQGGEIGHMEFDSRLSPSFELSPDGSEIGALDPKGIGKSDPAYPARWRQCFGSRGAGPQRFGGSFLGRRRKGLVCLKHYARQWGMPVACESGGESQVLFEQAFDGLDTWGIPSRDGKRLAFLRWTTTSNVWIIDDF
jgi:hypothetical protein